MTGMKSLGVAGAASVPLGRRALMVLLALELIAMMILTVVDVVGRYGFNAPLAGAKELTVVLLALVVFGAAPLVTADRTHITTALFDEALHGGLLRLRDTGVALIGAVACGVLAWRLGVQAGDMHALRGATPLFGLPIAPVLYFLAAMSALCAVISLWLALRSMIRGTA